MSLGRFWFLSGNCHTPEKNVIRLGQLAKPDNPQVASLAEIVLEGARLKPYKTRRLEFLAQRHPELLRKLEDTGLIFAHTWDWEIREVFAQSNSGEAKVNVPEDWEGTEVAHATGLGDTVLTNLAQTSQLFSTLVGPFGGRNRSPEKPHL